MKRRTRDRLSVVVLAVLLWVLIALVFSPPKAHAQGGGYMNNGRQETTVSGRYVSMWNATGTEIADGTVVMVDTVAATSGPQIPMGKGFKTWTAGTTPDAGRVVGIVVGNCPSNSQGRVMVEGFHNNCLMDATAITGFAKLRPSLSTAGALGLWATTDSLNSQKPIVGYFQRYKDGVTLRGFVWVKFPSVLRAD